MFFPLARRDAKIRDETKTHVIRDETKIETPALFARLKPRPRPRLKMELLRDNSRRDESLEDYITEYIRSKGKYNGFIHRADFNIYRPLKGKYIHLYIEQTVLSRFLG